MKKFLCLCVSFIVGLPALAQAENIVTTIEPLQSLVQKIALHPEEVTAVLTNGASPHGAHLKPSQIKKISEADIVFYVDDNLELFIPKVQKSATHPAYYELFASPKLLRLKTRSAGVFADLIEDEDLDHDHHEGAHMLHEDHHEHEEAEHEDHHHAHSHGEYDVHAWLDPQNARAMLAVITEVLSEKYPENAAQYAKNKEIADQDLTALDKQVRQILVGVKGKKYLTFHDAYQYFEVAYNVTSVGTLLLDPEEDPSPSRLADLQRKIRAENVVCVFREPQFNPKLVDLLQRSTGVATAELDPLGQGIPAGKDFYDLLLLRLAENVASCS